ncbi:MAG: HIT domain-containing protein [Candidatus Heimdallarchaeota archaeon]|nr:HIT domain-containing protein [Candidatus Heimdallarchaeota archaeon]
MVCTAIETGVNPFGSPTIIETENIIGLVITKEAASRGHCIFLPKVHVDKMHKVEDEVLAEIVKTIKRVVKAMKLENYNVLQNNGAMAFQTLFHVHFHLIPKNSEEDGLMYLRDKNQMKEFDQTGVAEQIIANL